MKTAIYLRQSLDKNNDNLGVDRQCEQCLAFCRLRGYEVVEIIEDNNRSAFKGKRPGYARLLQLMEQGNIQAVVALA